MAIADQAVQFFVRSHRKALVDESHTPHSISYGLVRYACVQVCLVWCLASFADHHIIFIFIIYIYFFFFFWRCFCSLCGLKKLDGRRVSGLRRFVRRCTEKRAPETVATPDWLHPTASKRGCTCTRSATCSSSGTSATWERVCDAMLCYAVGSRGVY